MDFRLLLWLFFILFFAGRHAENNATDYTGQAQVFLFHLENNPINEEINLTKPQLLTGYNVNGYNDFPFFADSSTLFVCSQKPVELASDIYKLNITDHRYHQITKTSAHETSPQRFYEGDTIYSIVINRQNDSNSSSLRMYDLDKYTYEDISFKHHIQFTEYLLLLHPYLALIEKSSFQNLLVIDIRTEEKLHIGNNVQGGLCVNSDGDLLFIQSINPELQYLRLYELDLESSRILTRLPVAARYIQFWEGYVLYGVGHELFAFNIQTGKHKMIANLQKHGILRIGRLSIYNNKLALVNQIE